MKENIFDQLFGLHFTYRKDFTKEHWGGELNSHLHFSLSRLIANGQSLSLAAISAECFLRLPVGACSHVRVCW